MGGDTQQAWWTTVPGLVTALAALITAATGLLLGLNEVGLLDSTSDQSPSQVVTSDPGGPSGGGTSAGSPTGDASSSSYEVSLAYGEPMRVGDIAYEVLEASARPDADGQLALVLDVRGRSYRAYDENFWDASFRVTAGEDVYPASGGLNKLLPANATAKGELLFVLPDTTRDAILRISFDNGERSTPIRIKPVDE
jgi:hypothetical protein